ncbi:hypothetical protein G3I59_44880 [Amycolatopsis rubida]|uniref:CU044_5270 family protein n=1 Tax=Amycolatopsis rubida TaxID=112413 RepID=A0ABX0CC55_9PSEU|nr:MULTISPECIES: hypothetical protein [Amycolatopsis]MYW97563.1 hypothetical protein [Amycolatopsis rubida]NEC62548.1 hypothetical protein [Amycolatopsis rubida]OAP27436.1 hypothetical protein A4R44_01039 [Amycolatopsis sp. M39]
MNDDTVRQLWSDAELDGALAALHPHETATDRTELDRARASMMRAAAAVRESDEPEFPQRKKRSGAWRWLAVAAAVALLTGGVVVARELASAPSTLAPAGPASTPETAPAPSTQPAIGMLFTHVVNNYSGIAWVNERSAFIVREQVDFWIPTDPSGTWIRRWSRSEPPKLFTGPAADVSLLPGAANGEDYGPGGAFTDDFPHPGGSAGGAQPGWFHPTPGFLKSLPTDPALLTSRLLKDRDLPQPPSGEYGPVPQLKYYGQGKRTATSITYPSATGMVLSVLTSGLAPTQLRIALTEVLDNPVIGFHLRAADRDTKVYAVSDGTYETLVTVDQRVLQVKSVRVIVKNPATGFSPGTTVGSAQYTYELSHQAGN